MRRRTAGFTLIEILVTLAILGIVLASAGVVFNTLLGQYKQQSRVSESGMEGIIGLGILRRDIEQAGFGLPWNLGLLGGYTEAADNPHGLNDAPNNPPRAIVSNDGGGSNPDYLVLRSTSVPGGAAGQRWTTLKAGNVRREWLDASGTADAAANPQDNDRVIVLWPGFSPANYRTLVCLNSTTFSAVYPATAGYAPATAEETHLVYGIDTINPRRPFNRADYHIVSDNVTVPQRCAPGTGVLVKATLNQADGTFTRLPILDCVADFQVMYRLDTDGDGALEDFSASSVAGTAQDIRNDLREVRVDILTHDGRRDESYTHSPSSIPVGVAGAGGRTVNVDPKYRWKVYTLLVRPDNLR